MLIEFSGMGVVVDLTQYVDTDHVVGSDAKVLSPDGDLRPGSRLFGRNPSYNRWGSHCEAKILQFLIFFQMFILRKSKSFYNQCN
jgi:hypothetical protein